ncbi:membrane protein insertase YidC [Helicobacter equorum]|uniref:Membrane protein insertase YidC n=1 Tax=Helicobacter equorum TaxID=361872 RepID=A0A3D8IN27_9HELI|nr:membrane protein insertase YidC [Helicobacter equorum]RDU66622.1 membrane protein insertase YidC [Helicobacter equorum]
MYYPNPNQHNNDNTPLGRIMLVVVLSIAFFGIYMYLFPPKQSNTKAPATTQNTSVDSVSPISASQAPTTKDTLQQVSTHNLAIKDSLIAIIESEDFEIEIDALGRIRQVSLKDKKFTHDEQESLFSIVGSWLGFGSSKKEHIEKLPLFGDLELKPLEMRFSDVAINKKAYNTPFVLQKTSNQGNRIAFDGESQNIVLTQDLGDVRITKTLTFYRNLLYDVRIEVSNPNLEYFISNGMRPMGDKDTYVFRGVLLKKEDGSIQKIEDGDGERKDFPKASFVASVDRYYTSLLFTPDVAKGLYISLDSDGSKNPMPYVRSSGESVLQGYIGPKDFKTLESINPNLTDVVEYGMITFFARWVFWLLAWLYDVCGNWGWSIVLLTLIVRVILYPLSYKGMVSMQKLKDLAPKMKEIQERYKGDPQKLQMHMMELYKKHGANPLGGCLPLLLQIPVFFAIYRVLYNAIELKNSAWIFWINDLSAIDPYFVLPVLMGVSMYVSQRLTPSNFTDPMQEKIFKMLPWFFMVFFIIFPFPAGLVLYWTINNIFSIIQQMSINAMLERKKQAQIAQHHAQNHFKEHKGGKK